MASNDDSSSITSQSTDLFHPMFPGHWDRYSLHSLATWVNGLVFRNISFSETGLPVIKIAEIKGGISGQTKYTKETFDDSARVTAGDLLFSWSGQPETSIDAFWWRGPDGWLNQHVFRVTPRDGVDSTFLYYLLRYLNPNFVAIARNKQTTGLGHVTKRDLQRIEVAYPELEEQRAIAGVLGALDDKIEQNRRTARALERLSRAIFRAWFVDFEPVKAKAAGAAAFPSMPQHVFDALPTRFVDSDIGPVPEGWEVRAMAKIATFLNGLALQKYPPRGDGRDLRVIKIAQLRRGSAEGADWANGEVPQQYVIRDRDLLFSWSGTLEATFWFGGPGALNQHIFKVTSSQFPPWFCLLWLRQHLPWFRSIAASKATTMGHIKKGHLHEAKVVVPPASVLQAADGALGSMYELHAATMIESRRLDAMRELLLPKLLSGEVRVTEDGTGDER